MASSGLESEFDARKLFQRGRDNLRMGAYMFFESHGTLSKIQKTTLFDVLTTYAMTDERARHLLTLT